MCAIVISNMHSGVQSLSIIWLRCSAGSSGAYLTASFSMAVRFSAASSKIRIVPNAITLAGTCRRVDIKPKIPPLEKPGAGTQIRVCWAFGGMRQHVGATVAAPRLEKPQGAARTAAQAGFYGSCERVSVTVRTRGGASVPTGTGDSACSAGTFHTYQRMGVSIPAV